MSTPAEMVMASLKAGNIPDSFEGLDYSDLRPGFNPLLNNFDIVGACSDIMFRQPNQVENGQKFLNALYNQHVVPAYGPNGKFELQGSLMHWAAAMGQVEG